MRVLPKSVKDKRKAATSKIAAAVVESSESGIDAGGVIMVARRRAVSGSEVVVAGRSAAHGSVGKDGWSIGGSAAARRAWHGMEGGGAGGTAERCVGA